MGSASFSLLISLIHNFTAPRRGRPTPLVAFVDRVSPFSPISAAWRREGRGDLGERTCSVSRSGWGGEESREKEQVKWKWQSANIPAGSCAAFSIVHHPLHGHRAGPPHPPRPPVPGTRTCRSQPCFHRQPDNLWAGPGRGSPQCALEKTPYAWKSPLSLSFVQQSFMGQHWALWGLGDFSRDSIEGYNPFRHGTNKKVLTCCFHIY